jgi:hypothetical protein
MSYELNSELSHVLVHMESVLDQRLDRSDALIIVAAYLAKLAGQRANLDSDVSTLERLENNIEQMAEQIQ